VSRVLQVLVHTAGSPQGEAHRLASGDVFNKLGRALARKDEVAIANAVNHISTLSDKVFAGRLARLSSQVGDVLKSNPIFEDTSRDALAKFSWQPFLEHCPADLRLIFDYVHGVAEKEARAAREPSRKTVRKDRAFFDLRTAFLFAVSINTRNQNKTHMQGGLYCLFKQMGGNKQVFFSSPLARVRWACLTCFFFVLLAFYCRQPPWRLSFRLGRAPTNAPIHRRPAAAMDMHDCGSIPSSNHGVAASTGCAFWPIDI